jgi:hypothetical protein
MAQLRRDGDCQEQKQASKSRIRNVRADRLGEGAFWNVESAGGHESCGWMDGPRWWERRCDYLLTGRMISCVFTVDA